MNAIAAVFGAADPHAARAAVTAMLDRMPRAAGHRVSVAADGGVAAAGGAAPSFGSKAFVGVVAGDLRIDNRVELRRALGINAEIDDASLVLEAFERWGDSFPEHLAGDFAFVLFDRRERRMLAVRDALGIRPLYYRAGVSHVRCASELGALVEDGDKPDEGFLAEVLAGDIVDTGATPFVAVRRVPAGHMLIADGAGVRVVRHWEPPRDLNTGSPGEHAERFREVFDDAVRARVEGVAHAGVHLSGGLDSSSVLGSIAANGWSRPIAGSMRFPWPEADEGEWIAIAARRASVVPIEVHVQSGPAANDLASIAQHRDLPDLPTGAPLLLPLHGAMKDAGAAVVLTGFGGDQWWTGEMAHMSDLVRRGRLGALRRWRRRGEAVGTESSWDWRGFLRYGIYPLAPQFLRKGVRHLSPAALPAWIPRAHAEQVHLRERLRRRPDTSGAPSESWRRLRWRIDSGEEAFIKDRFDRTAAAGGVELRHPFYDRRLVELAFRTPQDAMIDGRHNRAVMRAAMRDRLAPETVDRTVKADLWPVAVDAARAPEVRALSAVPVLRDFGWIEAAGMASLSTRLIDDADPRAALPFWRIIGVEAWLQHLFGAR